MGLSFTYILGLFQEAVVGRRLRVGRRLHVGRRSSSIVSPRRFSSQSCTYEARRGDVLAFSEVVLVWGSYAMFGPTFDRVWIVYAWRASDIGDLQKRGEQKSPNSKVGGAPRILSESCSHSSDLDELRCHRHLLARRGFEVPSQSTRAGLRQVMPVASTVVQPRGLGGRLQPHFSRSCPPSTRISLRHS